MLSTSSVDDCKDRTSKTITGSTFEELLQIEIPNVFTPNGDGVNDYFEIKSNGDLSQCIELSVFNRNGAIVHKSTGGVHVWNGRSSSGNEFPDGVYFYIFTVNGKDYKGTITLLRAN